jgi:hypothetical protein
MFLAEQKLLDATSRGDVAQVAEILNEYPKLNVNCHDNFSITPLRNACAGESPEMIRLLLAHPNIDVNKTIKYGWTPFMTAFNNKRLCAVKLMLRDPRVDPNRCNDWGLTSLCILVMNEYITIIKWWIASGRTMWLGNTSCDNTDAVYAAMNTGNFQIRDLLCGFTSDHHMTRHQVRVELGWYDEWAADIFALVTTYDGRDIDPEAMYTMSLAEEPSNADKALHFFGIASKLPVELQMVLCYRASGSTRTNIPVAERERGFGDLAWWFLVARK